MDRVRELVVGGWRVRFFVFEVFFEFFELVVLSWEMGTIRAVYYSRRVEGLGLSGGSGTWRVCALTRDEIS